MHVAELLLALVTLYAAFWASYVLFLPIIASLRVPIGGRSVGSVTDALPTVWVIVPAHNMEQVIGRCIESVKSCCYPRGKVEIYVVADHCSDATAERARIAGASVLIRNVEPRGKTYTLAWAIEKLTGSGIDPDLYLVVDATSRVDPGFLNAIAKRAMQAEDIIIAHAVVDPENRQWFAQCIGLSLAHRNLQNWSRERLGLSSLIEGRGMAYSRRYIMRHGWSLALPDSTESGSHPTEDWRHGVRTVQEGWRVSYEREARVFTPLRGSLSAATEQGIRWEQGRVANAATYGLPLLLFGLRQYNRMKVMAGLDAIQPPVAVLAGLCIGVAVFGFIISGSRLSAALSALPLILICIYAIAVLDQGRRDGIKPGTILWTPVYVGWRCMSFVLSFGLFHRKKATGINRKQGNSS